MNLAMSFDYFSAYNNKVIVDPAMDFTVEELYLDLPWLTLHHSYRGAHFSTSNVYPFGYGYIWL